MEAAGVGFFVAAWAASIVWAIRDAARRCNDRSLRVTAALGAIALPFVGVGLYLLARPAEERLEVKARRLRIQMLERAFAERSATCSACGSPIQPEFRCCPQCGENLGKECHGCGELLRPAWSVCPWCTEPVAADAPEEPALSEVA